MAQLSFFYASTGQTDKGIEIAKRGLGLGQSANNITKLIFLYSALGENYHKANQPDEYNATLETIIRLKDSLYKKNSGDAIAEMEAKYNLQKQQNIIITQNYALTRSRYISIGSSLLFILGLLLLWVLYRNYRIIQKRKMEFAVAEQKMLSNKAVEFARESERKRIAADLHDNLGSYAAAITANVKYLREKQGSQDDAIMTQLDANAQSMVTQLSDTIWVLKNEYLPFTGLADRFKLWMLKLMQNYPLIKYHYNENIINDIEFTPARILNIFLMLKECVNNAVKHSNCTEIKIDFFSGFNWRISIEDNGRGFESSYISKGSGIDNIKNRAGESGWVVTWENVVPSGTRVVIADA
jgi:signal transduction histidine kinase